MPSCRARARASAWRPIQIPRAHPSISILVPVPVPDAPCRAAAHQTQQAHGRRRSKQKETTSDASGACAKERNCSRGHHQSVAQRSAELALSAHGPPGGRPTIVQRARLLAHEGLSSYHSSRRLIALEPLRSPSSGEPGGFQQMYTSSSTTQPMLSCSQFGSPALTTCKLRHDRSRSRSSVSSLSTQTSTVSGSGPQSIVHVCRPSIS